jgi:hypothetical protein
MNITATRFATQIRTWLLVQLLGHALPLAVWIRRLGALEGERAVALAAWARRT